MLPRSALALALIAFPVMQVPADAQVRRYSHCIAIADAAPGIEYLQQAAWTDPVAEGTARISYVGHSMFLIQSEGGVDIVTDFNGYLGPSDFLPDAVTMNRAHSSHWTDNLEGIAHVFRGWSDQFGIGIDHHTELGDVLIRNVTSDIRSFGTVEENGNSIFVFEMANLCIAHLGHLHQEPSDAQYAALGRVDVLMVPVDGIYTMAQDTMMRVVQRLQSSLVIPMHWFNPSRLEHFLAGMSGQFVVEYASGSEVTVSLSTLPPQPTILVLQPAPLMR
ncbi:MBL fold metallo-hydrolase [Paracoccus sp. M683]|uniref:MBL fold metallo-hydrolase n=1 Tax=Paracoccus sp. M683 TaxID=2594268 RepID=UPI00117FF610|nr:MBL fold metallo-hydrolase [Paracoccus sp. M683]TRW96809.1 MBL fold metallo-hydrolase [Paracoccus sp. M683]